MSPAVGQDGDLIVFNGRLAGEGFRHREEFVGVLYDGDAGPLIGCFGHFTHAGQGACVGTS